MPYLLHHLLDGSDADDPRIAIVHGDQSYTYGDLKRRAAHLAARLTAAGVIRGDRVAFFLPKSFDECAAIFAASAVDAVFVPINPGLKPSQVRHILEDCAATVLLTASGMLEDDAEGRSSLTLLPALKSILLVDADAGPGADAAPVAQAIGEDLAAILYTSGSTGQAEGRDAEPPQSAGGLADRHQLSRHRRRRPDPVDPAVQLRLRPESIADRG